MSIMEALIRKGSTGGNNIEEAIENLPGVSGAGSSGGSDAAPSTPSSSSALPSVTSEDEGKVLTVNAQGQWGAAPIPDGTIWSFRGTAQDFIDAFEWGAVDLLSSGYYTPYAIINEGTALFEIGDKLTLSITNNLPMTNTFINNGSSYSVAYTLAGEATVLSGELPIGDGTVTGTIIMFPNASSTTENEAITAAQTMLSTFLADVELSIIVKRPDGTEAPITFIEAYVGNESSNEPAYVSMGYYELYDLYGKLLDNPRLLFVNLGATASHRYPLQPVTAFYDFNNKMVFETEYVSDGYLYKYTFTVFEDNSVTCNVSNYMLVDTSETEPGSGGTK